MKKFIRSALAATILTISGGAAAGLFAGAAGAAGSPPWEPDPSAVGSIVFYNAAGQQITGGSLTGTPIAAYAQGSTVVRAGDTKATLYAFTPVINVAPGAWNGESLSSSTVYPNATAPAALAGSSLPLVTGQASDTSLSSYIAAFPNNDSSATDGYAGIYQLRLRTSAVGSSPLSTYDAVDIAVSGSTWSVVYPTPTLTSTTTVLTASPVSPQIAGTSVTLTATVTGGASGTVQFLDGTTDLGSPVTVTGGVATYVTSTLPIGSQNLSAVFTPSAGIAYSGSTGTSTFVVTPAPAAGTTTALGVNPSSAPADTAVTLSANVSLTSDSTALASGTGSVAFYDNGSTASNTINASSVLLGTQPVGTGGTASLVYSFFAQGTHNVVAVFTASNSALYQNSTSAAVVFTAGAPAGASTSGSIDTTIPAGGLTISTPYSSSTPFQLGTAVLNSAGTEFTASAPFGTAATPSGGITITDTRAGDLPWTATGSVSNFSNASGGLINGEDLSFTGVTASYISGNALQSGDVTTTNVPSAGGYSTTDSGTNGLGGNTPHTVATTAAGAGSVYIYGNLSLVAPSSTPGGAYSATLVFTVS